MRVHHPLAGEALKPINSPPASHYHLKQGLASIREPLDAHRLIRSASVAKAHSPCFPAAPQHLKIGGWSGDTLALLLGFASRLIRLRQGHFGFLVGRMVAPVELRADQAIHQE